MLVVLKRSDVLKRAYQKCQRTCLRRQPMIILHLQFSRWRSGLALTAHVTIRASQAMFSPLRVLETGMVAAVQRI